jgi:hypothetical protein
LDWFRQFSQALQGLARLNPMRRHSLIPTACPVKTVLKLILLWPGQMRPQLVTTMILSPKG